MNVTNLSSYIEAINKLKRNYTFSTEPIDTPMTTWTEFVPQFIFRGHSNDRSFNLLPGVFRWKEISPGLQQGIYSQLELNILNDFISDANRYTRSTLNSKDMVSWLEIAQHFGVPTRLLDFTTNPLVALYFACTDDADCDGSVWIINENTYNRLFFNLYTVTPDISDDFVWRIVRDEIINQDYKSHTDEKYIKYPWIYRPTCREERMSAQSSVFMLWGADRRPFENFIKHENNMLFEDTVDNEENGFISKVVISANDKATILQQLDLCGVNEKLIYPGLDGIGKYVKYKYSCK